MDLTETNTFGQPQLKPSSLPAGRPSHRWNRPWMTVKERIRDIKKMVCFSQDQISRKADCKKPISCQNDEGEQDRLDRQHNMCVILLDGNLGLAPVRSPKYVLDIATGTGIWATQFAERNPESNVLGTDLTGNQRKPHVSNVSFLQHDAEGEAWNFPNKFDYIHMRYVVPCFDNLQGVIKNAFDSMNPGGWIEFLDSPLEILTVDDTVRGTGLEHFATAVEESSAKLGRDLLKPKHYASWLREAGFVNVVEKIIPVPGNPWSKDPKQKVLGGFMLHDMKVTIGSMHKFYNIFGYSKLETEKIIAETQSALEDTNIHFYWNK
ncbi:putative methyltransferase tdiE-like protein [Cladobotryum mycophilum]|uniref:Methyltransferase tdiE-like protein n=1 Tax=Cladobotryum mycophilum TaxID=491253 RepID=A0ABR0SJK8_9HYPO